MWSLTAHTSKVVIAGESISIFYCVDKFHMTKYINAAANQMLDEAEEAKANLYKFIYKK